jgi:protease I
VDVSGTAATAKLRLDYEDVIITDYMSLLKVDGQWVIVGKIFDRRARAAATSAR